MNAMPEPIPFKAEGPQPLLREIPAGEAYPVHALGPLRGAVEAVQGMSLAPIAIPAASALAVASLAVQGFCDVETLGGPRPVSLYALTIAQSGERKSSCDAPLMAALRAFEKDEAKARRDDLASWENAHALWKGERDRILAEARKGKGEKRAMTKHFKMTPGIRAAFAAGKHLSRKDGGDALEILTKRFGDFADAVDTKVKSAEDKASGLTDRVKQLEQRAASERDVGDWIETWGNQLITDQKQGLENLAASNKGSVSLNVKALTNAPDSMGPLETPTRTDPVMMPQRRLTIRNLLSVVEISTGTVEYIAQTARPTGAATVAEGAAKPESNFAIELKTTTAQVIAHHIKASRQVLEDHAQLRDLIDSEMRYGLALAEEVQLLTGNGVSPNLRGLIPAATAFDDPLDLTDATRIDTLGAALLQSALADFPATGIVMHPSDWVRISLLKDADGNYIIGNAVDSIQPRLFGVPVVPSKAMAVGDFLVGDFARAATIYDRWQPRVEVGFVDQDFTRNMVTILAEERIALAVKQPLALTYGSFE